MDDRTITQGVLVTGHTELNPNKSTHYHALFHEDGTPFVPGAPTAPGVPSGPASNLAGPFVVDASKTSGQERFDGIVLTTLESGRILHDITWRLPLAFNGTKTNQMSYLGTEDINFLLASEGDGWGNPTNPSSDSSYELGDIDVMVGEWMMPEGGPQRSLLATIAQVSYLNWWGAGPFVPEGGNNDLVVKIPNNWGEVDDSTMGQVYFYVHYL